MFSLLIPTYLAKIFNPNLRRVSNPCPGLFKPIVAQDGILSRLRVPGGILTFDQCQAIANLSDSIQITNRANLQIRGEKISPKNLTQLQSVGLAAFDPALDSLRNILCSPTAGIDQHSIFDVIPLVKEWNSYLSRQSDWQILSAKFSVGFDGGEAVSISDRSNDLLLASERLSSSTEVYFRLYHCGSDRRSPVQDTGILVKSSQAIQFLAALTEVYYRYSKSCFDAAKPPRLRQLIEDWGLDSYLAEVTKLISFSLIQIAKKPQSETIYSFDHIGIHNQSQPETAYIGIVVPLGRISSADFMAVAAIANDLVRKDLGKNDLRKNAQPRSEIRLTAWQNLIIPHIPLSQIEVVKNKLLELGLSISATDPYAKISACIGSQGCSASFSDTHIDAQAIAHNLLTPSLSIDQNIDLAKISQSKIHLSGCAKLCAQNDPRDLTLVAIASSQYQVLDSTAKKC